MSEALPNPSLPIFGEETVSYTIMHPRQEPDSLGQGGDTTWEYVEIPVDEIDSLDNPSLREALWNQYRALKDTGPFLQPFLNQEGKHISNAWVSRSHDEEMQPRSRVFVQTHEETGAVRSFSMPTQLIGEVFTAEGPIKSEDYRAYLEQKKRNQASQQKSAGFISRILLRKR